MKLGASALPPQGFVAFCERRPDSCGADPQQVLAQAARADADRAALMALLTPGAFRAAAASPSSVTVTSTGQTAPAAPAAGLAPFGDVRVAGLSANILRKVSVETDAGAPTFRFDAASTGSQPAFQSRPAPQDAPQVAPLRMTPELWAKLNKINARINRAIRQRTDPDFYGQADFWATPLEEGLKYGDCEDFVLEKRKALVDSGVAGEDLNIALVTTSWGESHAVLLVSTTDGEFVLDNLTRWVTPWQEKGYVWRQRQVNGDAFHWAMVDSSPADEPGPRRNGVLIASLR